MIGRTLIWTKCHLFRRTMMQIFLRNRVSNLLRLINLIALKALMAPKPPKSLISMLDLEFDNEAEVNRVEVEVVWSCKTILILPCLKRANPGNVQLSVFGERIMSV
jgi:hypothetical protein